jgi:hypothetical protein
MASDTHTIFIKTGFASTEQIHEMFAASLEQYQLVNNLPNFPCTFIVNRVENRDGETLGMSFVHVSNPEVYYMLLGKNPDGSDRVEYYDDPDWIPKENQEPLPISPTFEVRATLTTSWSEMMEEEEKYERQVQAQKNQKICPKIPRALEPLMRLPPVVYTPEQMKIRYQMAGETYSDTTSKLRMIPESEDFFAIPALLQPISPELTPNILKCRGVPEGITERDLKDSFTPYVSDSTSIQIRTVQRVRIQDTYPFVSISDNRTAFVTFDPETNDAGFALFMKKKTYLQKTEWDGQVTNVILFFNHAPRDDRDMTATSHHKGGRGRGQGKYPHAQHPKTYHPHSGKKPRANQRT